MPIIEGKRKVNAKDRGKKNASRKRKTKPILRKGTNRKESKKTAKKKGKQNTVDTLREKKSQIANA